MQRFIDPTLPYAVEVYMGRNGAGQPANLLLLDGRNRSTVSRGDQQTDDLVT